ncbi:hypothetical protein HMPREF1633_05020 [Tissierellia bacterium S5-A11]|nr:hypothetical protein HMPREF1633_05020 [Tissierellia bacterium S5-A11]
MQSKKENRNFQQEPIHVVAFVEDLMRYFVSMAFVAYASESWPTAGKSLAFVRPAGNRKEEVL